MDLESSNPSKAEILCVETPSRSESASAPAAVIFTGWKPPPIGWLKINTDGSCDSSAEYIAAGGVLRDCNGNWVCGFSKYLGTGNSLLVELWGIYLGIKLAKEADCTNLIG